MVGKPAKREIDTQRLCQAVSAARRVLRPFRENRRELTRLYVGRNWSDAGADRRQPLNLVDLYVRVVSRSLVAKNPRVMLSTFAREHKAAVSAMQSWANARIAEMDLANTLRRVVLDALFSVGIAKVALATPADAAACGYAMPAGTPYCDRVDLDDFAFDVKARDFAEADWLAHRLRVPVESVRDTDLYKRKVRAKVAPTPHRRFNEQGDQRIGDLQRGDEGWLPEDAFDYCDVWEVYVPREKRVLTLLAEDGRPPEGGYDDVVLRDQEWVGPDRGPYHFLSYGTVPGNAMPLAPLMNLKELHESANENFRKLMRQASRLKDLTVVNDADEGARVNEADDGHTIPSKRPDGVRNLVTGGPNAGLFAFFSDLVNRFSWAAGNLDAMGGLSPQAKTLGQDRMLMEGAGRGIADMQDTTVEFASCALESLTWFFWHDPFAVQTSSYSPPGVPTASVRRHLHPRDAADQLGRPRPLRRQAKWSELDLRVDPYSLQHSTPQSRAAALQQVVTQVVAPMLGVLQQQGVALDMNALLTKLASYLDMPDLPDILSIADPPRTGGGGVGGSGSGGGDGPRMPASTERSYVRRNVSARSSQDQGRVAAEAMAGTSSGGAH